MASPTIPSPRPLNPSLAKAGNFGLALAKLNNLTTTTERIRSEYVVGAAITRHLRLAGELEKLQKILTGITKEEFGSLDDAVERKIVIATRWETVVKAVTLLCISVKNLPKAHPNRSKLMKKEIVRVLEAMEAETENARQAVEWFTEREFNLEGKTFSKGAHLVSQIARVVEEWKKV